MSEASGPEVLKMDVQDLTQMELPNGYRDENT